MKQVKIIFGVVLMAALMTGCGSSKKMLQQGNYYAAVMESIKHLRSSPENKKQQQVLLQAYPLALENGLRIIGNAMNMGRVDKYCVAVEEYMLLNQMADAIYSSPKALQLIPNPRHYGRELSEVVPLAAEEAYSLGEGKLRLNTVQGAREAYTYFAKANEYVNGYRDVYFKMREALEMGTIKVIISKPITPQKYQLTADYFYNNLMSQIRQSNSNDPFIRFYTETEAHNERLSQPDHYLVLDFNDFAVGNIRESKGTTQLKRDSVVVGTTLVYGKTQNVYGTVKADFTTYRREVIAQGTLSAKVVNAYNNRVEEHRNIPGKFVWVNEWASFNGDERALTEQQKKMAKSEPLMPPPQQDLFIEFTKPILSQTVSFVRNFYNKYR